jgi:hypothetical protein
MDRAVALLCTAAVISAISAIAGIWLVDYSDTWSSRLTGPAHGSDSAQVAASVGVFFGVPLVLALWLGLAWANANGKSWARTVSLVLTVIQGAAFLPNVVLMSTVHVFGSYRSAVALAVGIALFVGRTGVAVWAVWLLYRPESSAFYAASERPRFLPPPPPFAAYPPHRAPNPPRETGSGSQSQPQSRP